VTSVVTIAGSDPGGGAGIQADLLTFAAHGVHGASVVIAATAQNSRGISAIELLSVPFVIRQLDAVFSDFSPAAVKVGMLADAAHVTAVASSLRRHRARNVVVDPVLRSTSGTPLLAADAVPVLRREVLPLARLVTPNLDEAEALAEIEIRSDADRREAARRVAASGARAVLVTGGHGPGERIRDLLWDGKRFRNFEHRRIAPGDVHGTGCVLSASIAANLALGFSLEEAVSRGIRYLRAALRRSVSPGSGARVPVHAFIPRSRSGSPRPSTRSPRSHSSARRGRKRARGRGSSPSP
jgi:hydroxymethylpyrimidine/phosphomethylpyrimidine kinase